MTFLMEVPDSRNGMNWSQARSQQASRPGYFFPKPARRLSMAALAAASLTAVQTGRSAAATFFRSFQDTYFIDALMRWMTHVCTIALGQATYMASSGLVCQAVISSAITPVTLETSAGDTSAP